MRYVGDRKQLTEEKIEGLEEIVMDAGKAAAIVSAAKSSMGKYITLLYCSYLSTSYFLWFSTNEQQKINLKTPMSDYF